ncbi:RHS repeat-associated core domain-containing protein [Dactylosporangium sp. AC04546]|uniref:RHS repeat-associated core domain-containing protein n=1 Tax=Dactylosporangium sp. AC04546 TaxID=2862460 RepID=UPI001EE152C1|nr:RHS repeat-associated core domain-containing protein [Dactylosporangium sp. AC04546]WVK80427.1 RHS repeat-associated core domain-containing protein [Dactylosporangium sp. AC04546]
MSAGVVLVPVLAVLPAHAEPGSSTGVVNPDEQSVAVSGVPGRARPAVESDTAAMGEVPAPVWPVVGSAVVAVAGSAQAQAKQATEAAPGGLPVVVRAGGPVSEPRTAGEQSAQAAAAGVAQVQVSVLGQSVAADLGVKGVVLMVARADGDASSGAVGLDVDYAAFATGYGGDYGGRLRLVSLPGCATSTPALPECQVQTPLGSVNNPVAKRVSLDSVVLPGDPPTLTDESGSALADGGSESAESESAGVVLALTSGTGSQAGDWSKTSLSPSGSWSQGGSSGDFTYSVPLKVPPSLGGPAPNLALQYSSAGVDGKTTATNAQASWVGDGWDLSLGYIERSYKSCSDDGAATGDLCWASANGNNEPISIVMDGVSGQLVRDSATGEYKSAIHTGWSFKKYTGAANADNDGEYWQVMSPDGTQYFFGRGAAISTTAAPTNSTANVPVYGNNPGEPCYAGSYAASSCLQAYRWNLDYIVDPRGNSETIFYQKTTGKYGHNNNNGVAAYDANVYPIRIEYGTRAGSEGAAGKPAPMMVEFGIGERCNDVPSCSIDVPWDQFCGVNPTSCPNQTSPAFFMQWRLAWVTTKVLTNPTAATYQKVDEWTLDHDFLNPFTADQATLWLEGLQHTGYTGGTPLTAPAMAFGGGALDNRVDYNLAAGVLQLRRYRLSQIENGTGGVLTVYYAGPDCSPTSIPSDASANIFRCFPQYWAPEGGTAGFGWFHKYVVTAVQQTDLADGSAPPVLTSFGYSVAHSLTKVLWGHDPSETSPLSRRSWSDWRGYTDVTTTTGPVGGTQTVSSALYYRGLHGDRANAAGATRTSTIDDSQGTTTDFSVLRGKLREETSFGPGGSVYSLTLHTYGYGTVATRALAYSMGNLVAYNFAEVETRTATHITTGPGTGGWRWTKTTTETDSYTLPTLIRDWGDEADDHDDRCTAITYADRSVDPGNGRYHVNYQRRTLQSTCNTYGPGSYLAGTFTYYDGNTTGTGPVGQGLVTRVDALNSVDYTVPATFHWQNTANTGYDAYGRVVWTRDPMNDNDHKTTTQYTPASDAPVTQFVITNPLSHSTTTTVDPGRGLTTQITDPNGKKTRARYDQLGRLTDVWLDDRATTTTANLHYAYSFYTGPSTMNVVTTTVLGPSDNEITITSYDLYDGNLRQRQNQAPAPQAKGGRIVTDTRYDGRGLTAQTTTFWNVDSPPAAGLVNFVDTAVKNQHRYTYDTLGRQTADALYSANALKWQTTTEYDGNFTTVTPPDGGTATTTYVNGRGKTTELRQYLGDVPTGSYQATTYTYDRLDRLRQVQDQSGNIWKTDYNLLGQVESTTDPDRGETTTVYDGAGRPKTVTDANTASLTYAYDELGRKTGLYDGTTTSGFQRAKWTYDIANNGKGLLASSTRYVTGNSGTDAYTTTVTGYDNGYRPLGTTTVIPSSLNLPGLPSGNYTTSTTYYVDGSVKTISYPAAGGLPAETVTTTYDNTGRPLTLGSDPNAMYVAGTSYYGWGAPYQQMYGNGTKRVLQTTSVDEATGRLTSKKVETEDQSTPNDWVQRLTQNYGYNNAGNVKYIREIDDQGATVSSECFNYDGLSRLTYAWTTANSTCGSGPSTGVVGGPDPYWLHYVYDATGNRTLEERYTLAGTNTTRQYIYPTTGQRHTLSSVEATGDATGTDNYEYDNAGNMTTRSINGKPSQDLKWDSEGHLTKVTDSAGTTSYIYDVDGNRLVSKDPTGVTVYLGGFELRKVGSTTTCTRYIGQSTRTAAGLTWIIADHHETGQLAIDSSTLTATRRKSDPFGNPRGSDPVWPDSHGFVGGVRDGTGLTHLGAREYDPATGRFISDDLITDRSDPQQMNGYTYASNSPVTSADPTGMWTDHDPDEHKAPPCSNPAMCDHQDSTGGVQNGDDEFVKIGEDVVVHKGDPNREALKDAYKKYSGWPYCSALLICNETKIWLQVCNQTDLCPDEFESELSWAFYGDADSPLSGDGRVLLGTVGAGEPKGVYRSLTKPQSMYGASEGEVRALVPEDWVEQRLGKGEGVRWGTPGRRPDQIGNKGFIEFNYGNPNDPNVLHRYPFIRVSSGGLQYRTPGKGSAVGVLVQHDIQLGKPGPGLAGNGKWFSFGRRVR